MSKLFNNIHQSWINVQTAAAKRFLRLNPSWKLLCIAALVVALNGILFPTNWVKTHRYAKRFLTLSQLDDSWGPMKKALKYLDKPEPGKPLYTHLFFEQEIKFQYPPTSLLVPLLFSKITERFVFILKCIGFLSILATIAFCALIYGMNFLTIFSLFLLTLFFFPVTRAFDLGQIQTWINAMFAALFYFWLKDRQIPGGVLLGLMSLIKPQYVIIAVWGALRRKWQFLRSFAFVFLGGIALSFLLFGGTNNLNYLEVLSYLSQHGEAFFPNQSMNGLLNRLFLNGDILIWQAHTFPPYHPVVYWGSLIFGIGLIVFALSLLGISRNQGGVLDLSIIAMAATMASPIAWEHHYGILLPIYVYLFSMLWRQKETKYLPALSFSYALSSNYIPAFRNFAYVPGWNILLSYLFVGAFVLLLILFKLLQRQPREGTATI